MPTKPKFPPERFKNRPFFRLIKTVDDYGSWEAAGDELPLSVIEALGDAEEIIKELVNEKGGNPNAE